MKKLLLAGVAFVALAGGGPRSALAAPDEALARLEAIEKENAILRKENAALRERAELSKENIELRARVERKENTVLRARVERKENTVLRARDERETPPAMSAHAAALPVKAPVYKAPESIVAGSALYFWVDGMYDRVRLPTYKLGYHAIADGGTFPDTGTTVQTFNPRLDGGGVRGAVGYVLPGTSTRFEFGGSFVGANSSQSQFTSVRTVDISSPLMNGVGVNGLVCAQFPPCNVLGRLTTDYNTWQLNGKVASDWTYGSVTVTPSLAVFGGNTRVGQTLSQSYSQVTPGGTPTGTYQGRTRETWRDIGARVGVDVSTPVTTALAVGIGGWVGGANRHTSLSGNDIEFDPFAFFNGTSALSVNDSKTVLLANAEGGFAYKVTSAVTARGFAGVNYDGSVPGITNPTFAGFAAFILRTPAAIYYAHETSVYAGGGLAAKF